MIPTTNATPDAPEIPISVTATGPIETQLIPLERLVESEWNPRQYYPDGPLQELVESMRSSGFRQWLPLLVRPMGNMFFEIGAGHRRRKAAELAGIEQVPCIVQPMTDEEFLDVLNFDNTAREDVHPLHEAAGWQHWMQKTGKGVADIASKIGQSIGYVYQRLKYASLIDDAKKAFLDDQIRARQAVMIARLQPEDQAKALKFAITDYQGHVPSVRQLGDFIQRNVHLDMARASFDLASVELLPAAGSCNACPKRTKNAPDLLLSIERVADPNRDDCTDPSCFNAKLSAHIVQLKAKLEAGGAKPLEVSGGYGKAKKGVLGRGDYCQASGDTKNAQPAIVADGPNAGTIIHITVNPPKPKAASPNPDSQQAKLAQEKREAAIQLELSARRAILDAILAKVTDVSRVDLEYLLPDLIENCADKELTRLHGEGIWGHGEALAKFLAKLRDVDVFQLAVEVPLMEDFSQYRLINKPAERLLAAAKRYKVDAQKIRIQVEGAAKKPPVAAAAKKAETSPAQAAAAKKKAPAKAAAKKKAKAK